jgi:hypothetical protein
MIVLYLGLSRLFNKNSFNLAVQSFKAILPKRGEQVE